MSKLKIKGGAKLSGEVKVQGAKNEALQIVAATLLTRGEVIINNLPNILDVNNLLHILQLAGAIVHRDETNDNRVTIRCEHIDGDFFLSEVWKVEAGKLRGSIMLMGPALSRFGAVAIPTFGGDKIGKRPIDTHLHAFQSLGYKYENNIVYRDQDFSIKDKKILLEEASLTGTANMIMASAIVRERLIIYNAASEPYIEQLCRLLNKLGLNIDGYGTNRLIIENNFELKEINASHEVLPDLIEVASFVSLAAVTNSDVWIRGCSIENLGMTLWPFRKLGINFDIVDDDIHVHDNNEYTVSTYMNGEPLTIYSEPWPKVSPDILSLVLVAAVQSRGTVLIHEKMYESRLFFVDKLIGMGAQIILCDPHRAVIVGLNRNKKLQARSMDGPDIRAGMALLIAALSAEGVSTIDNAEQIDRGYEKLVDRLHALGADIERIV